MTPEGLRAEMEEMRQVHAEATLKFKGFCGACYPEHFPCDAYRAASMVLGVLEIHKPRPDLSEGCCCGSWWPCPTIQAMCEEMGE